MVTNDKNVEMVDGAQLESSEMDEAVGEKQGNPFSTARQPPIYENKTAKESARLNKRSSISLWISMGLQDVSIDPKLK